MIITLATGLGGYAYIRISATLNQEQFSALEVLAFRFWLLWLVSGAYVLYAHQLYGMTLSMGLDTLYISLLALIIPIYFSQKAIAQLGADRTSLLLGFTPLPLQLTNLNFVLKKIPLRSNLISLRVLFN